jgi:hypothetical protein
MSSRRPSSRIADRHSIRHVAGLDDPFADLETALYAGLALTAYLPGSVAAVYEAGFHANSLEELAHRYEPQLGDAEVEALHRELPDLLAYLDEVRPPAALSLALFSCRPAAFLEGWRFHGEIEARLWIAETLRLEPLRLQLQLQPPALVLLADKEHARAYTAVLDHVEELLETAGQEIHVQRQRGASARNWQHKEEVRAHSNIEELTRWLATADDSFIARVFLAGPAEPRAELRRLLPPRYASKLVGELHLPMYESVGSTAERIREMLAGTGGGPIGPEPNTAGHSERD